MSFVGCQNEQKKGEKKKEEGIRKKGELIQPDPKIDERRQLVQHGEVKIIKENR